MIEYLEIQSDLRIAGSNTTASLTLGGYDVSRLIPNDISFSMAPDDTRDLLVGLQAISFSDAKTTSASLLSDGILAFVDSTIPWMVLPISVCKQFENAFGLTWDSLHSVYLVNDTLHESLVSKNASFTFQLGNTATGGQTVNYVLPYSSFDLNITVPVSSTSPSGRYFPLKQATSSNQYTLGRTFLQET